MTLPTWLKNTLDLFSYIYFNYTYLARKARLCSLIKYIEYLPIYLYDTYNVDCGRDIQAKASQIHRPDECIGSLLTKVEDGVASSSDYKHIYLLPGIDGTGMLFNRLAHAFGYRCRTTVLPFIDEVTLEDYIQSASARLPENKVLLLAESFSGLIALELLARYPGRFQAAILSAAFARSPFGSFLGIKTLLSKGVFGKTTLDEILLNRFCSNEDIPADIQEEILAVSEEVSPATIKNRLHIMDSIDTRPLLHRISAPVLYLAGLKDKLISPALRAELFESIPRICFKGIDGPHLLLQTQPEACVNTIMNFLEMEDES